MNILNLTQHQATAEQVQAGVVEPTSKTEVQNLLTFDDLPTQDDITQKANALANIAKQHDVKFALIGGAPYLMSMLEQELVSVGITPLYAFSKRVSVEHQNDNGEVVKQNIFKHVGFVGLS